MGEGNHAIIKDVLLLPRVGDTVKSMVVGQDARTKDVQRVRIVVGTVSVIEVLFIMFLLQGVSHWKFGAQKLFTYRS